MDVTKACFNGLTQEKMLQLQPTVALSVSLDVEQTVPTVTTYTFIITLIIYHICVILIGTCSLMGQRIYQQNQKQTAVMKCRLMDTK